MNSIGWIRRLWFISVIALIMVVFALPVSSEKVDPRKERLLERVNSYWNDRVQGKIGNNYDYYDPFFRARVKRVVYEASLVEIKFLSYKIGDKVEVTENIAKVPMKVEFEIPETVVMGKKIVVPPKKDEWVEDWIWIDGDWFKVFKLQANATYIPFFPSFPP